MTFKQTKSERKWNATRQEKLGKQLAKHSTHTQTFFIALRAENVLQQVDSLRKHWWRHTHQPTRQATGATKTKDTEKCNARKRTRCFVLFFLFVFTRHSYSAAQFEWRNKHTHSIEERKKQRVRARTCSFCCCTLTEAGCIRPVNCFPSRATVSTRIGLTFWIHFKNFPPLYPILFGVCVCVCVCVF